jgi:hypothetical protein
MSPQGITSGTTTRKRRSDAGKPRPETLDTFLGMWANLPPATREVLLSVLPVWHRRMIATPAEMPQQGELE